MIFKNSIFGEYCSILLNNFFSSLSKYNELSDSYSQLKDLLISGQTKFPKLNLKLEELIDVNNLTYVNIFATLMKKTSSGISGYSKTKIYEKLDPNIDNVLDDLELEYKNIIMQLQTIWDLINKNVRDYKLLIYLLTNIDSILHLNTTFEQFDLYHSLYRFIYEKQPLSSSYSFSLHKDSELITIPTLVYFSFIKNLFRLTSSPTTVIFNDIYTNSSYVPYIDNSFLANSYNNYIDNNLYPISQDLEDFINHTIYYYGINVSNSFSNHVKAEIVKLILETKNIVTKNISTIVPANHIYRIIDQTVDSIINSSFIEDALLNELPIWSLENYSGCDEVFYDKMYQWEDIIAAKLEKWLYNKSESLAIINYIHTKFASNPTFAINAHVVTYAKVALDYLSDVSLFANENVEDWLNIILAENNTNIRNIIEWVKKYKIRYHEYDFNFISFLILQEFINYLIENDDFNDFIVKEFIPNIDNAMLKEYKSSINWYKKVDDIKYIFKLILCNDLIEGLNTPYTGSSTKLFFDLKAFLAPIIDSHVSGFIYNPSSDEIESLLYFERHDVTKWYNILNSFYKSSFIARYTDVFLKGNYSIL